ncbi:chaplin [Streptomyces monashensis]|uniref:Chaplin domain-containing protein n=1 Tax=Streptomyces monashensis TaxID=1678012 RepID=A0A1S2PJQ9_9ACTN|nr:chaplin [Streptomyces monashensis]OIJ94007.1 hypothetical protein BIV23_36655 [Streptomyces monashensis]
MIALVTASGAMAVALPVSAAFAADSSAAAGTAAGSPGLVSGNGVQLPVDLPVNVCGNTVDVVGLLNPAMGNRCANTGGHPEGRAAASGGAAAHGAAHDSPGVLSGNGVQLPVDLPVNISGNSVNVVGIGNPAVGNTSVNGSVGHPRTPRHPHTPPPAPVRHRTVPPAPVPEPSVSALAHTGADATLPAAVGSAALLLGGAVLYRRFRPGRAR